MLGLFGHNYTVLFFLCLLIFSTIMPVLPMLCANCCSLSYSLVFLPNITVITHSLTCVIQICLLLQSLRSSFHFNNKQKLEVEASTIFQLVQSQSVYLRVYQDTFEVSFNLNLESNNVEVVCKFVVSVDSKRFLIKNFLLPT